MSKVYVVQDQKIWKGKDHVSKFDFSTAEEYGDLVMLLESSDNQTEPERVIQKLKDTLEDYTSDDHLLLVGNPCLIGWTTAIAATASPTGEVKMLQWSGRDRKYLPIEAKIF